MLALDVTVIQISTCSRKLSMKAVLMEMTTRKWYTGELGYDRLSGTRKIGPSHAKSVVNI